MEIVQYDIVILEWVNSHRIYGSVPVLQFISNAATYVSISVVLMITCAALLKKAKPLLHSAIILGIVLVLSAILIQIMKETFDRERPFLTYPFIEKLSTGGGSSFPSGHSMESFAMAMAICLLFRQKWLIFLVYGWACLVAYSRLALGVHYPADVLAGILIGTVIGWFVPWIYLKLLSRQGDATLSG